MIVLVATALLAAALGGCGSAKKSPALTPAERDAQILAIADRFGASGDVAAAQRELAQLDLADPAQAVLALAESYIVQNGEPQMTQRLVLLAQALGPLSRMAGDYLAATAGQPGGAQAVAAANQPEPPTPTATPVPPTDTPVPTPTDTPEPTPTPEPTATPTATPVPQPQAVASAQGLNVRGGPGTVYPVIGELGQGETATIIGRNPEGSWWQIALANGKEGWVAASLVTTTGPVDAVELAANIPAAPPTATPRPAASAPPAAPTPRPAAPSGPPFVVSSLRVRPLGQDAQQCGGGDHSIFVWVVDAAGNPLNGVRVREVFTNMVLVTGEKGPGVVWFDIYKDGGGQVEIVDDNNSPLSPQSRGMSSNLPDWDLFEAAGYCNCKPYPDSESCRAGWEARDFRYMPMSHYVYEVVFRRQY